MNAPINRRKFLGYSAASAAVTLVPRHVLGGAGQVAPSQKIKLAYIGCGTQGLREMLPMLAMPEVEIVAVCDPMKDGNNYVDWSKDGLRRSIGDALDNPGWRKELPGIHGGREVAKEIVESFYANKRGTAQFKGCTAYADYRELLEKEQDINAVKVITPDHLHAIISIAAMRKGKSVLMHKPLANRLQEARWVIDTARQTQVRTHFIPASPGEQIQRVASWIKDGAVGTLREIHNWSNRPVWPQYSTVPTDTPSVPPGFDWDLWLGPSTYRPYHPHYTHAVFRGWYEFGGGPIADMGHYSLWPVFREFSLDAPILVESTPSHVCSIKDQVSTPIRNDYSFPIASTIRMKFAAKNDRPALDLFWYDGGIKPATPDELSENNAELEAEGMMFVGDKGKILGGFRCENPQVVLPSQSRQRWTAKGGVESKTEQNRREAWVKAFQGGEPTYGDFRLAGPISEAFNLAAISLRMGGKRLIWDAAAMKVTNNAEANKYLGREYRPGWEIKT